MRRAPALLAILAIVVVCFPPTACAVRADEFLCEDAVAKLQGCCSKASVWDLQCTYVEGCTSTTYPTFDERESRCIIHASCSELLAGECVTGVCR